MANQVVGNKYTWVIKEFSSLQSKRVYSDPFVIGGCKWSLRAYPKGDSEFANYFSLFLEVAEPKKLCCGWRRNANYRLTVVNQSSEKLSLSKETKQWFDQKSNACGFGRMLPLSKLCGKDDGFLVNDEVKIVVEVEVLEVIGRLDVLEESEEVTQPPKKVKREAVVDSKDLHIETVDVNGFQVLPSQVDFLKLIFEKHPDIAVGFRAKNQHMRKACMNFLLSLIETLCQSPQDLSNEDLVEADNALAYVTDAGFKVDWLEKKLYQVKEKKKEKHSSEARMKELEKELKEFKQKCIDAEALLEKEKAKVVAAGASLTLDEIIMT